MRAGNQKVKFMKASVYNQKGEKTTDVNLPESVFNLPWSADLVHQVSVAMMSNKRAPYAHTKGRGEVSGGGKKPWRQKGLGKARHGSIRSPIWVGGGVAHGPTKEKDYSRKINDKMKKRAFYVALSQKLRDGEILFVDKINFTEVKTKEASAAISSLSKITGFEKMKNKKNNKAILALDKKDISASRAFRNIPGMTVVEARNLNVMDILNYKYLIIANPEVSLVNWKKV